MSDVPGGREWESGWDGHSRAQQERLAKLPLAEKIAWLEEAQKVAESLNRSRGEVTSAAETPEPEKP